MKVRICYTVKGHIAFLSHLEMVRLWQRGVLRSGLPISWTQGFNPRPKMSTSPAKGVGIESEGEYVDFEFEKNVAPDTVKEELAKMMPEGLNIINVREIPKGSPSLEATINEAEFCMIHMKGWSNDLEHLISDFMAQDHCFYIRTNPKKTKEIDLRKHVISMNIVNDALIVVVSAGVGGSLKPVELLRYLGFGDEVGDILITRRLYVSENGQKFMA